jgi:hypothetical protein
MCPAEKNVPGKMCRQAESGNVLGSTFFFPSGTLAKLNVMFFIGSCDGKYPFSIFDRKTHPIGNY